jgi:NTE family protein
MTRALVHSGGAAKGAWATGVIRYLLGDLGISYDIYTGTSVGAINVAFLAMFKSGEEQAALQLLTDWWLKLDSSKIYKPWPFWGRIAAAWRKSFYDSSPLHEIIRQNVSLEKIRASGKKISVGALNLHTGKYTVFNQDSDNFIDAVLASSAFPAMLSPIKINNDLYIDGGMKTLSPIKMAIEMGADEIDVITTSPDVRDKKFMEDPNIIDIVRRAFDVATDKILSNDIELAMMYNQLAEAGLSNKKPIKLRIIKPHYNLLDNVLDFDPRKIREMMELGYKDARLRYIM